MLFLVILAVYLIFKWLKYYKVPENFPPGPPSAPFVGTLPFIKGDFKSALQQWRDDYGEIVGLNLGSELAVVLSDYQVVSAAFKDDRFTGRPKNLQTIMKAFFASSNKAVDSNGIVFSHGHMWQEQRRFALRTLRDQGFGKSSMESIILEEVNKLVRVLEESKDDVNANQTKPDDTGSKPSRCRKKSTNINQTLSVAVVNSLWSILTGEKINHGDKRVEEIVKGTDEFIRNESLSGPLMMFPWMRHLPIFRSKFKHSKRSPLKMRQLQDDIVARRRASRMEPEPFNEEDEYMEEKLEKQRSASKDFIDIYLEKVDETKDENSSFYGPQGLANLQRSLTDLFGAGSETSSSVLLFAFLYMIKYPEVQEKIQKEIDHVMGSVSYSDTKSVDGRKVSLTDRQWMPYTDAVIHEILRHSCLVYAVPQATTTAVELDDYDLPKQTTVYANIWAVMHDPEYWNNPQDFNPDRFLTEEGHFRRDERCIPFMLGKRYCIGQSLAQNQLFLFFTGILQRFKLIAPGGPETVSTDPYVGFIHRCPLYEVELQIRE